MRETPLSLVHEARGKLLDTCFAFFLQERLSCQGRAARGGFSVKVAEAEVWESCRKIGENASGMCDTVIIATGSLHTRLSEFVRLALASRANRCEETLGLVAPNVFGLALRVSGFIWLLACASRGLPIF